MAKKFIKIKNHKNFFCINILNGLFKIQKDVCGWILFIKKYCIYFENKKLVLEKV